jgi:arylsulfatase A-like enzyme
MAERNLVLIVLDAFRYDHFRREAARGPLCPNLVRLAEEGVCFDDAISPSGYTVPAHASFFTGKRPSEHGMFSHLPSAAPTMGPHSLLPLLRRAGYTCLGVSDNPYFDKANVLGADFDVLISTRRAAEERRRRLAQQQKAAAAPLRRRLAAAVAWRLGLRERGADPGPRRHELMAPALESLLRALPGAVGTRPVFLYCNLMGTHEPYSADPEDVAYARPDGAPPALVRPESFHAEYRHHLLGIREMSPALVSALAWSYAAAAHCADRALGGVMEIVDRHLGRDRTDIVVTADHGEMLGEHGAFGHAMRLYEGLVRVPLLVISPDAGAPRRVPGVVQTHWLWNHFLERAGIAESVELPVGQGTLCGEPGSGQVALSFSGPDSGWEWLQTALSLALREGVVPEDISPARIDPHVQSVRSADAALIISRSGERTVWQRGNEGPERELSGDEGAEVAARLSKHLVPHCAPDPRNADQAGPDEAVMDRLRDLGYVD